MPTTRELSQAAREALRAFGVSPRARMRRLNDGENTTWRVTPSRGAESVLRLHRFGYHTDRGIRAELAWLDALARDEPGLAPAALEAPDGDRLVHVEVGASGLVRAASLLSWTPGRFPRWPGSRPALQKIGVLTATLHNHSKAWRDVSKRHRAKLMFDDHVGESCHWGLTPLEVPGLRKGHRETLRRVIEQVRERLDEATPKLGVGLIHGDLHLANVLLDGPVARAIDFDDAMRTWFMLDPAVTLAAAALGPKWEPRIAAYWKGYEEVGGPIHPNHHTLLPTVQMMRLITMFVWSWTRSGNPRIKRYHASRQKLTLNACRAWVRSKGASIQLS